MAAIVFFENIGQAPDYTPQAHIKLRVYGIAQPPLFAPVELSSRVMITKVAGPLAKGFRWIFVQFNKRTHLEKPEQEPASLDAEHPLIVATELHTEELNRRRNQLWVGLWSATVVVLVVTFIARRVSGEPVSPLAILIHVTLNSLVLANFIFMRTRYSPVLQGIYVLCIHLAVPSMMLQPGGKMTVITGLLKP
ncbi:MAG: hypothetical protein VB089_11720 [Anaerolineaceae bacterium]|nr:hypothetical protein [Anaerolineaceae bacterium]